MAIPAGTKVYVVAPAGDTSKIIIMATSKK